MRENVKHDEELEKLLDEIPQITSYNLLHQHPNGYCGDDRQAVHGMYGMCDDDPFTHMTYSCVSSPVSGLSLVSDGSSSGPFSGRHPSPDNGSPTMLPLEELKSPISSGSFYYPNSFCLDSKWPDLTVRRNDCENLVDEFDLCATLRRMHFNNQHDKSCNLEDASIGTNGLPFRDCSDGNNPINVYKQEEFNNFMRARLNRKGVESSFPSSPVSPISPDSDADVAFPGFPWNNKMAGLFGARHCSRRPDIMILQPNDLRSSIDSSRNRGQPINNFCYGANLASELTASLSGHPTADTSSYRRQNGISLMQERSMSRFPNSFIRSNLRPYLSSAKNLQQYNLPMSNARAFPLSNTRVPQAGLDAITSEGSFIIQGEGLNYVIAKDFDHTNGQSKGALRETGYKKNLHKSEPDIRRQVLGNCEIPQGAKIDCSFPLLPKCNSLAEARGYIYLIAKDQQGCRFLQRMFDEGTPEGVQVIFNEIINHVVELMVNPFGNYPMQKLLGVCTEEQRMQIILMVTLEPGQLVRISLNTHGTRVVQKLIETLKTRQQISLVVSALEPGFLELIKDLNGNHVIQRCLQFLGNEDNRFIFVAAAKYCIEVATHQHGCCVLQRCISHSSGEHRERLIAEISANALLLAQDQYGNYVVQYILDLRNPYATACIISQFEGHYVHLSKEKFSSHVVEKCFAVFDGENRSRIICELLSAPHFEQLLQDPHANYVVQSALQNSSGPAYDALVQAIESHKAVSRNSPYSKKIFSLKLWKK